MDGNPSQVRTNDDARSRLAIGAVFITFIIALILFAIFSPYFFATDKSSQKADKQEKDMHYPTTIPVGTSSAQKTIDLDSAIDIAIDEGVVGDGIAYIFCRSLVAGETVATLGDDPKYDIAGDVFFVYVDSEPNAFFEHPVEYVFIDAASGETMVYEESWPPDVNGRDAFELADECGGMTSLRGLQ